MYYVYILLLSNKQFYIGYTNNLKRRLNEHKSGKDKFTKKYLPIKLIFCEVFCNEKDARKRERYFKTNKGKFALKAILKNTLK
jgi:putative endonuclease